MTARLDIAIAIAAKAFEGKFDKGGKPYILHCLHVMEAVSGLGEQAMIVGVLHDLIEDTDWTEQMLIDAGFEPRTAKLVSMVTHKDGEDYLETYIPRTSLNPITRAVKMADLEHNSTVTRQKGMRDKDKDRIVKYHTAYFYLQNTAAQDSAR